MTNRTLIVAAPTPVRAATSILLGLAVAVMAMPIPHGFKVICIFVFWGSVDLFILIVDFFNRLSEYVYVLFY